MSAGSFFGQYRHSVDDKGRVSVPARFRQVVEADAETTGRRGLWITRGFDGCLYAYSPSRWEQVIASVQEEGRHSFASRDQRRFQRQFFAAAAFCEPDGQGRVLIPEPLRALAGLGKQAVFAGVMDHIEIWDADRWDAEESDGRDEFEQAAQRALEGDGN